MNRPNEHRQRSKLTVWPLRLWQNVIGSDFEALVPAYPLVFFDAIRVKIRDEGMVRSKAIHIALGVRASGKEVLGMGVEQNEGQVLAACHERDQEPRH